MNAQTPPRPTSLPSATADPRPDPSNARRELPDDTKRDASASAKPDSKPDAPRPANTKPDAPRPATPHTKRDAPASANTLIYVLAHESREAAAQSWDAFRQDQAWLRVRDASQVDGPIVTNVESVFMEATDFSPLK